MSHAPCPSAHGRPGGSSSRTGRVASLFSIVTSTRVCRCRRSAIPHGGCWVTLVTSLAHAWRSARNGTVTMQSRCDERGRHVGNSQLQHVTIESPPDICWGGGVASGIVLRLLGPVEVLVHDTWSTPRKPQQRLVLAMFALRAGQVVPVDELIDAVWEEEPPRSARGSLQVLMTRLRQTLARVPGCQLERYGDGYRLQIEPGQVDVHQFRALAKAGRAAADGQAALAAFDLALALWRGPALADVRGTARVEAIRSTLAEEHLGAASDRIGGLLDCGLEREAAAELPALLARNPLAERLAGMLMVALHRCGERGDALQVFRDIRGRLRGELGVEPGPELKGLYRQILAGTAGPAAAARHRVSRRRVASGAYQTPAPSAVTGNRYQAAAPAVVRGDGYQAAAPAVV